MRMEESESRSGIENNGGRGKGKMEEVKIEKVTLNIGVGGPGDKLDKTTKLLGDIAGAKSVQTKAKKRIPTWGVRLGLAIGCKVTLRKKKAEELLRRLLHAVDNKLARGKFDNQGNLSFGIDEYILIPGVKYDASVGVIGLEVAVTLCKAGKRVGRRKIKRCKIPRRHGVKMEEAIKFMQDKFGVEVVEEDDSE